jgi:5'-3' exonuclease
MFFTAFSIPLYLSPEDTLTAHSELPETVYLVDASIYIFQAHFSPHVECNSGNGEELSAVYGFVQFLLQFLRRVRPSHIAVAMDESLFTGFRHQLCPQYKSNRELPDENLALQLKACAEVTSILGLACYSSCIYEADDIIGTLSKMVRDESAGVSALHIVSRDKDLAQLLLGEQDCLWDYSSNRKRRRGDIKNDFGVSPIQFPDYLGLIGDSVDCISGIPGVGPVKAIALLESFDTLEGVYQNLDEVSGLSVRGAGKLAVALKQHRELAELSKLLATIVCEVEEGDEAFAKADIAMLQNSPPSIEAFETFLMNYGFKPADRSSILRAAAQLTDS